MTIFEFKDGHSKKTRKKYLDILLLIFHWFFKRRFLLTDFESYISSSSLVKIMLFANLSGLYHTIVLNWINQEIRDLNHRNPDSKIS